MEIENLSQSEELVLRIIKKKMQKVQIQTLSATS